MSLRPEYQLNYAAFNVYVSGKFFLRVISDVEAKDGKFGRSMYENEYTLPCFHQVLFISVSSVLFGGFVATQLVKFSNVREEPISVL